MNNCEIRNDYITHNHVNVFIIKSEARVARWIPPVIISTGTTNTQLW